MTQFKHPRTGQVQTAPSKAVQAFLRSRGYEPHPSPAEAGELKGAALDAALDEAGLPKSGTADEKRARLAEHLEPHEDDDVDDDPTDPSQTTE